MPPVDPQPRYRVHRAGPWSAQLEVYQLGWVALATWSGEDAWASAEAALARFQAAARREEVIRG